MAARATIGVTSPVSTEGDMKKAARKAAPKKADGEEGRRSRRPPGRRRVAAKKAARREGRAREGRDDEGRRGRGAERAAELAIAAAERANARDAATIAKIERSAGKNLVIVESPAKAKTIEQVPRARTSS